MNNLKNIKGSNTHQKCQKQHHDNGNDHADNKDCNDEVRSNNENSHILEQILSDMAWYG